MLGELYRRRREVGKVFDGLNNKLVEKKACSSSQEARIVQGRFVALRENPAGELRMAVGARERDIEVAKG